MEFIKEFNHQNEDPHVEVKAIIKVTQDQTLKVVDMENDGWYMMPHGATKEEEIIEIEVKANEVYELEASSHYDFLMNGESAHLNDATTIDELFQHADESCSFLFLRLVEKKH